MGLAEGQTCQLKGGKVSVLAGAQKPQDAEKHEPTFALAVLWKSCWIVLFQKALLKLFC